MSWISSIFSRDPQIYGAPYEDKNGKIRIRIFQYIGGKRDNLFYSSIEDTYPDKAHAVSILKRLRSSKILTDE